LLDSLLQENKFFAVLTVLPIMIPNTSPYDLNIPMTCSPHTTPLTMVRRALALGYQTIALNTEVSQNQFLTKKQAKEKSKNIDYLLDFPSPPSLTLAPEDYPLLASKGLAPTILTRLTISITNNDFMIHYNKSSIAKQYDLLAINVSSSPCLSSLLKSSFRWDILCFTPSQVVGGVKWTRKLYYECVEKNVYFELPYSPLIRDSLDRRRVISHAHTYHSVGKSRNIIFTSEARSPLELRSPTDVANLAWIMGLTENQGKEAVGVKGWAMHKAAVGRRMGPFQVRVEKIGEENLDKVPCSSGESEDEEEDGDGDDKDSEESDMDTK